MQTLDSMSETATQGNAEQATCRRGTDQRRAESAQASRLHAHLGLLAGWVLFFGLSSAATACDNSTGSRSPGKGGATSKAKSGAGGSSTKGGNASTDGGSDRGDGGGAGTDPTAGQAGAPPACVMPARWVGALAKSSPVVSVGKPVATNSKEASNAALLVDGKYHVGNGMVFNPSATSSTYASINVGPGYTKLLLTWRDVGSQDYGPSLWSGTDYKNATSPSGYLIKTSGDTTNGDDGTWTTAATVTGNEVRSRSHVFDFANQTWVRFEVTAAPDVVTTPGTMRAVRLDEIELHDISAAGPNDRRDTWFFMGDSITKMALDRNRGANEIDRLIAAQHPGYNPALVTAGNGGETLSDAYRHLKSEGWLQYSQGLDFVVLAFGTNDSWCSCTPESKDFKHTLMDVIELLIYYERTPVLARIPWNTVGPRVPEFNAVIDELQRTYELPCGPDLYAYFANHQDQLGSDHVHPTTTATTAAPISGADSINQRYAEVLLPLYPAP
jgi:acyl-CoA thioesterase I